MDEARARGRDGGGNDRRSGLVVFETAFVDMSEKLDDPVDLLFGVQLGGGADIDVARLPFASTPDAFPGLLAAVIRREDVNTWGGRAGV